MSGRGRAAEDVDQTTPSDRTTPSQNTQVHDRFAAEAWPAPPPPRTPRGEENGASRPEQRSDDSTPRNQARSSPQNYDSQARQVREEIRNDAHSTSQMSTNIQRIFDGIPREDRARALMQAFDHFGNTKYIQTADGEASITASAYGGRIGVQRPEVRIDVPEDRTVIPTRNVPEAVNMIADYLTKEGDAVRAHAVLNGYPPGERAGILRQAVLRANTQVGGDGTALIVEQLPGGRERLSVAVLHPASGKDFDPNRDVSLSIIVPSEQRPAAQRTDGNYQPQVDALRGAITKWDGVEANNVLQGVPRADRLNVLTQVSHGWDSSQYQEQADGTAQVGVGRGMFFPMEEGPWVERDRVNVLHANVPGDTTQIKPKDAAEAAQMIAQHLNAHDGIYAHRVLNSYPESERRAILQQAVDYWNQHHNPARDIPGTQMQMRTERLSDGRERLSINDTLSILVPSERRR